ncbi:MAG: ABC transporter permease [Spirochaetota bacterium]
MENVPLLLGKTKKHLAILLIAPLVLVSTLLLLLANGLHQYPLVVCNEDRGFDMPMAGPLNIPEKLVAGLDRKAFAVTELATPAEAEAFYKAGKARVLLTFPPELTQDMMIKVDDPSYVLPNKIRLEIASDNPLARLFVVAGIARGAVSTMAEAGGGISADSLPVPLDLESLIAGFGPAPGYMLTAILAFLAWVLTGVFAMLAISSIAKEGSLSFPAPLAPALALVLSFALAGWIEYLCLGWAASAILGAALPAQFLLGSLVLLLLLVAAAALGLAGGLASKPGHPNPVIPYLILPIFFGGFLLPLELLPTWLQWFPWIFPPFYGINAALAVELGRTTGFLPASIVITGLWAVLFIVAFGAGLLGRGLHGRGLAGSSKNNHTDGHAGASPKSHPKGNPHSHNRSEGSTP